MGAIEQLILDVRAWIHLLTDGAERERRCGDGRRERADTAAAPAIGRR